MKSHNLNVDRRTDNYEAMVHFYRDLLGLIPIESWEEPTNRGVVLALAAPTDPAASPDALRREAIATVEILQMDDAVDRAAPPPANVSFGFYVEDARAVHDNLLAAGVTIARALEDAPWGHRSFGVDDPDGLRVWIVQDLTA
jgi:catechol 2,3-dioxygenase-like lactoylglutathione lyase family enzyme